MAYTPTDPDLLASQSQGYAMLGAHTGTTGRGLDKLLSRYGVVNPEYRSMAEGVMGASERGAKGRLDAHLADSQLRANIMQRKINAIMKAARDAKKSRKYDAWSTGFGALGMISGMLPWKQWFSGGGPIGASADAAYGLGAGAGMGGGVGYGAGSTFGIGGGL